MSSDIIIAIIASIGSSGVVGSLVAVFKGRSKDNAEVTQLLRTMSKEAVADARDELADIKNELHEMKDILEELTRTVEFEVLPLLSADHSDIAAHVRSLSQRARGVV